MHVKVISYPKVATKPAVHETVSEWLFHTYKTNEITLQRPRSAGEQTQSSL